MPGIKALLFTTVAAVAAITMLGCCCGGGSSSSDWSDLESALEEAAASTGTETDTAAAAASGELKQCNSVESLSTCSEHTSKAFEILGEDFYKGICELTDGKWTTGSCPTENALGRCDDQNGSVTLYYKTGTLSYDAAGAEKGCTDLLGKWTAL